VGGFLNKQFPGDFLRIFRVENNTVGTMKGVTEKYFQEEKIFTSKQAKRVIYIFFKEASK
jgi:hypothetical protein